MYGSDDRSFSMPISIHDTVDQADGNDNQSPKRYEDGPIVHKDFLELELLRVVYRRASEAPNSGPQCG